MYPRDVLVSKKNWACGSRRVYVVGLFLVLFSIIALVPTKKETQFCTRNTKMEVPYEAFNESMSWSGATKTILKRTSDRPRVMIKVPTDISHD
mmetsp:Transcript_38094/g.151189  ORF Transcript_38094/g.151189 Transcript_38094/m.151189 type:complete len:93 (-) Transcript_38094:1830-2108(-)